MKKTVWLAIGFFLGYGLAALSEPGRERELERAPAADTQKILYWYDPMYPGTHFEKPGKSPFMDMDLVPRYADAGGGGVIIDPAQTQNLALTTAPVRRGRLAISRELPANVEFNHYQMAKLQPRAAGFVEYVGPFSAGEAAEAGQLLATIVTTAWLDDQNEYLRLKSLNAGEARLAAVREKLRLAGMPEEMLEALDGSGKAQTRLSLKAPFSGVIVEWNLALGMNVGPGQTAVLLDGVDPIWVMAEAPESLTPLVPGARLRVTTPVWPGRVFPVADSVLLPQGRMETRTVPLRLSVPNPDGLLRPGQSAKISLRAQTEEALLIPTQSLIDLGDEQRVITRTPDGGFKPKKVQTLRSGRDETAVTGDLEEGEEVVVGGLFLIDSEANLRGALDRLASGPESGDL